MGSRRLLELLKTHSYRKGTVVLASGKTSDFFIDCKQTALLAEGHVLLGTVLLSTLQHEFPSARAVAGVELGGCPLASAVALMSASSPGSLPLDALYVRKQAKDHGSRRAIEGGSHLPPGTSVVLVEDVVTTGGSSLQAVDRLREAGFAVEGVIALVDREEGGAENFRAAGIPFRAIFRRRDFLAETVA